MKLLSSLGWIGTVLGACSLLLCIVVLVERDPKHAGAPAGFLMFGVLFGVPGVTTLWRLHRQRQEEAFRGQLLGYVKSLDAFTVEELARKIGRTELEAEGLVAGLIQGGEGAPGVDLVFHRKSRQYMHRKRLHQSHHVFSRCPTCGAALGAQILFEGEQVACQYCDSPLGVPQAAP